MPPPSLPPPSDLTLSFRRLRDELVREGWYDLNVLSETSLLA